MEVYGALVSARWRSDVPFTQRFVVRNDFNGFDLFSTSASVHLLIFSSCALSVCLLSFLSLRLCSGFRVCCFRVCFVAFRGLGFRSSFFRVAELWLLAFLNNDCRCRCCCHAQPDGHNSWYPMNHTWQELSDSLAENKLRRASMSNLCVGVIMKEAFLLSWFPSVAFVHLGRNRNRRQTFAHPSF